MSIVSSSGARLRPTPKADPEPARKRRKGLGETIPEIRATLVAALKIEGYEVGIAEELFGIGRTQVYEDRKRAMARARLAARAAEKEEADAA